MINRCLSLIASLLTALLVLSSCNSAQPQSTAKRFVLPQLLASDRKDNVYVVDEVLEHGEPVVVKAVILKIGPDGKLVGSYDLQRAKVNDMAVSRDGVIYLLIDHRLIAKILPSSGKLQKIRAYQGEELKGDRPLPSHIAVDRHENIYITYGSRRLTNEVIKLTSTGRTVSKWRTSGPIYAFAGTNVKPITADIEGKGVFVIENQWVERFTVGGRRTTIDPQNPDVKKAFPPFSIAVDKDGYIYFGGVQTDEQGRLVNDFFSNRREFRSNVEALLSAVSNKYLYVLAWSQNAGASCDESPSRPEVIKFTLDGNLVARWRGVGQSK